MNQYNANAFIGFGVVVGGWVFVVAWLANPAWPLLWRRHK